ncbi:MAG: alginate export family protein [Pseudomonadota bacterium]
MSSDADRPRPRPLVPTLLLAILGTAPAVADEARWQPFASTRLKAHTYGHSDFPADSNAHVLDLHLGTALRFNDRFDAAVELEAIVDTKLGTFDDGVDRDPDRPVITDPNAEEINRAWVRYRQGRVAVKVGRQRLDLTNGRFIGSARFRLNEQTYDAVRFDAPLGSRGGLTAAFFNKVHRVGGDDHPQGEWTGDSYVLHAHWLLGSSDKDAPRMDAYHYAIHSPEAAANSLRITGARLKTPGKKKSLRPNLEVEFAHQRDWENNPRDVDLRYMAATARWSAGAWKLASGFELMEGDGDVGFQTPLARKHKFAGLSDQFLKTPAEGLRDRFVKTGYRFPDRGRVSKPRVDIAYHDFSGWRGDSVRGHEVDLRFRCNIGKTKLDAVWAHFDGRRGRADAEHFWLMVSRKIM